MGESHEAIASITLRLEFPEHGNHNGLINDMGRFCFTYLIYTGIQRDKV